MTELVATHASLSPMIGGIARKMLPQTGLDYSEAVAEGNLIFMQAFRSFDGRREFAGWLAYRLRNAFHTIARKHIRRANALHRSKLKDYPDTSREWSLEDFMATLGRDAREVINLAMEREESDVFDKKQAIKQELRARKWGRNRIREAFSRIRTALQEE